MSKTDSSGTYGFKRNGAGVTDPVLSDGAATYTPGISERRGGNSKFLHSGMKNADAQSGASANVDSSRTYDAFGNLTGSSGSWSGPFGYAGGYGYQEDPDHGLRLLGHRYYDSSTGRYISKDPIGDGRNWTAYCAGNPIRRADPKGLSFIGVVKVVVKGVKTAVYHVFDDWDEAVAAARKASPDGKEVPHTRGHQGGPGHLHGSRATPDIHYTSSAEADAAGARNVEPWNDWRNMLAALIPNPFADIADVVEVGTRALDPLVQQAGRGYKGWGQGGRAGIRPKDLWQDIFPE